MRVHPLARRLAADARQLQVLDRRPAIERHLPLQPDERRRRRGALHDVRRCGRSSRRATVAQRLRRRRRARAAAGRPRPTRGSAPAARRSGRRSVRAAPRSRTALLVLAVGALLERVALRRAVSCTARAPSAANTAAKSSAVAAMRWRIERPVTAARSSSPRSGGRMPSRCRRQLLQSRRAVGRGSPNREFPPLPLQRLHELPRHRQSVPGFHHHQPHPHVAE